MSLALLYVAVFAGGVLTILSPCILPGLPFVLARGARSEPVVERRFAGTWGNAERYVLQPPPCPR